MKQLIHFTATWCKPCEKLAPIIEELLLENPDIEYKKIDVDKEIDIVKSYQIMSVPTLIINVDSKEQIRHSGILTKEKLKDFFI